MQKAYFFDLLSDLFNFYSLEQAYKLRWGMKAQKKSRQKEKVIPERGFKKRSLNLAEA